MSQPEPTTVKVFTTTWCSFCKAAKAYLTSKKVDFEEVNVEQDQAAAMFIMQKTGSAGVPVIQIGDDFILGFDRERIDLSLREHKLVS